MKTKPKTTLLLSALLSYLSFGGNSASAADASRWPDAAEFENPSGRYSVDTIWQWNNGNLSKEGVSRDLQAMKEQGIQRALIHAVNKGPEGPVNPILSDSWMDVWRHAAAEGNRIGVKLATHIGPGWSESGGPWIEPKDSMKRVVWSHCFVSGGREADVVLPPLPAYQGWSRDIAVLAWPAEHAPSRMEGCLGRSDGEAIPAPVLFDGNPGTGVDSKHITTWKIELEFTKPHRFTRISSFLRWKVHGPPQNKIRLRIMADGRLAHEVIFDGHRFKNSLDLALPPTVATKLTLDWEILGEVESWTTFRQVQFAELELIDESESPRWTCELVNLAEQSGDMGVPGNPQWGPESGRRVDPAGIVDLKGHVEDGRLRWKAPVGTWRVVRFGYTSTGKGSSVPQKGGEGLETDKMSIAATDLHFRKYIERLIDALPPEDREVFEMVEADSWEVGLQNWTDDFATEFCTRRGYDIVPFLPVFAGEVCVSRETTERFLHDLRETIAELITERFYGRNSELLHRRNLRFAAELSDWRGPALDLFAVTRFIDEPMDEFWCVKTNGEVPTPPEGPPKDSHVPEAAFVTGKRVVGIEAFTAFYADFRRIPGEYAFLGDHALLWGFNKLVMHSYVHQPNEKPPGWTLGQHGEPFNRLNTWWPMIGDWLREISRAQYLLQTSKPVHDVLVYCGDSMPRTWAKLPMLPAGCRPLHIDKVALSKAGVKDGYITLDGQDRYRAIIVPSNRLRADTLETITRLVQDGATVALSRPDRAPGLSNQGKEDADIEEIALRIWGRANAAEACPIELGKGKIFAGDDLESMFRESNVRAHFVNSAPNFAPLMWQLRRAGDDDLYCVFNPNEAAAVFSCTVTYPLGRVPEIWDPFTGRRSTIAKFTSTKKAGTFTLPIEGRRTLYVLFPATPTRSANSEAIFETAGSTLSASLAIDGPFSVTFTGLPEVPAFALKPGTSWTEVNDAKVRHFSGIAVYRTSFVLPAYFDTRRSVTLDLGEVGRVARVRLNGQHCGTLWRLPWRLEVNQFLQAGPNMLEIEVANTWLNRMLLDETLPTEERVTFCTWPLRKWTTPSVAPERSGLLGTVVLRQEAGK